MITVSVMKELISALNIVFFLDKKQPCRKFLLPYCIKDARIRVFLNYKIMIKNANFTSFVLPQSSATNLITMNNQR